MTCRLWNLPPNLLSATIKPVSFASLGDVTIWILRAGCFQHHVLTSLRSMIGLRREHFALVTNEALGSIPVIVKEQGLAEPGVDFVGYVE